jgi:hypothetical protein
MERARRPWHRDGIPAWGWAAIVVMRLASLVAVLLPVALLAGGIWWWTHGGAQQAPRLARQAVHQVQAWADSLRGR